MNTGFPHQTAALRAAVNNPFADTVIEKTPESEKVITAELKDEILLDGERLHIGTKVKVSIKQHRALARHMLWIDGPQETRPIAGHMLHPSAVAAVFEPHGEKK